MTDEMMATIAAMEERAFTASVLAPRGMKRQAKRVHAQWAGAMKAAMATMPVDPAIAVMSDDELLAALAG